MKKLLSLILVLAFALSGCCSPSVLITSDDTASTSVGETSVSFEEEPAAEDENAVSAEEAEKEPEPVTEPTPEPEPEPVKPYHYTLCFAGDVSLADGGSTVAALNSYGLEGCFSEKLLKYMRNADVMCLNSEFAFTDGGTPLPGKTYTFRSKPERISVLHDLGVDLAVLANNHVFDYSEEGLIDTLNTFREAELPYIGAGENLEEASGIWYAELGECTVAYIAGSRVEWAMLTRSAAEDRSGVFRTAESNELMVQRIQEARENADFVVVYEHWGQEGTTDLEDYQVDSGKEFIDAGADVVVGDHPHVVQGMEWYKGKPIFYSMGNYWFTSKQERYTMLMNMELRRDEEGEVSASYRIIPAWTTNTKVTYIKDQAKQRTFFDYMESISRNVTISDKGYLKQPKSKKK